MGIATMPDSKALKSGTGSVGAFIGWVIKRRRLGRLKTRASIALYSSHSSKLGGGWCTSSGTNMSGACGCDRQAPKPKGTVGAPCGSKAWRYLRPKAISTALTSSRSVFTVPGSAAASSLMAPIIRSCRVLGAQLGDNPDERQLPTVLPACNRLRALELFARLARVELLAARATKHDRSGRIWARRLLADFFK